MDLRSRLFSGRTVLASLTVVAIRSGCAGLDSRGAEAGNSEEEYTALVTVAAVSALPRCTMNLRGIVYFTQEEDTFLYCDGSDYQELDLNGLNGVNWVIATSEPPAVLCPTGGATISAGPDEDGDGVMDLATSTQTICNGEQGPSGEQSPLLVSVETELPGANCDGGGEAIYVGLDLNDNGQLNAEEVTGTTYQCAELLTLEGNVTIASAQDAAAIAGAGVIGVEGDLEISGVEQFPHSVSVAFVGGKLSVHMTGFEDLSALATVTSVGGETSISDNPSLASLSGLDNLTSVGGALYITNNPSLANLSALGSLTSVGGRLYVTENPLLTSLNGLDNLTTITGEMLLIADNPSLTSLVGLDSLSSVGGDLYILRNESLSSLGALASLTSVVGNRNIRENISLTNLDGLDDLISVG